MPKGLPTSYYEIQMLSEGNQWIGGADEVGRGAFAGPVTTGIVIFSAKFYRDWDSIQKVLPFRITDSKVMSSKEREEAATWIRENSYKWSIGMGSVGEINKLGIVRATNMAFRRAAEKLKGQIDQLLIDAFFIPYIKGVKKSNQLPLVKGDTLSVSIAAASIIAKVHRDQVMKELGREHKYLPYSWYENKGYGTKAHRTAIQQLGITRYHRIQFVETSLKKRVN